MKAKLSCDAGDISKGTVVEIASKAGTNDARSDGLPPDELRPVRARGGSAAARASRLVISSRRD